MVRIILTDKKGRRQVKILYGIVHPLELLLGFVERGLRWEIDYKYLNPAEYYNFHWGLFDIKARCIRAILENKPIFFGSKPFVIRSRTLQAIQRGINEVEEIIQELVEMSYDIIIDRDDEEGVFLTIKQK